MTTTLTFWIASVIVAVLVGRKKNIPPGDCWALGLVLGWIGVVILLCMKTRLPEAPKGMVAVKCPRCNTVQNVAGPSHCFQCHDALPMVKKPAA
jgi:phage FluMu protein Com